MTENAPPGNGKGSVSHHSDEALISDHHRQSHHHERSASEEVSAGTSPVKSFAGTSGENLSELQAVKWKRRRCFVRDGESPEHALTWRSSNQRTARVCAWRTAVIGRYTDCARLLRIAWTIEGLAMKKGYAFCSDSYLSKILDLHTTGIQRGLTELERDGVIVCASVFTGAAEPERATLSWSPSSTGSAAAPASFWT